MQRHAVDVIFLAVLALVLVGCNKAQDRSSESGSLEKDSSYVEQTAESFAKRVVSLIAERRIDHLADLVHPTKGLLFSPYGYINRETAINLSAKELVKAWRYDTTFTWGYADGSGEPITQSIKRFFSDFVYGADYTEATEIGVDKLVGQGNSVVNLHDVFPNALFVEFHFPGFIPQYQGLDWRSLRVVMEKRDKEGWWLVAIVNDQWTI